MKGRKLTLQEVLQLEDGSKVWVEELNERYSELSGIHYKKEEHLIEQNECGAYAIEDIVEYYANDLEFYEWIDEFVKPKFYPTISIKMAHEICNLRGLDFTDENIEMIIKEFS